jgi:hypothetical protein
VSRPWRVEEDVQRAMPAMAISAHMIYDAGPDRFQSLGQRIPIHAVGDGLTELV